jgi:AI-2E family transporter
MQTLLSRPARCRRGNVRVAAPEMPSLSGLLALAIAVVVIAALYLARDLLVPVTLAVLLSFVLAPFVRLLHWARVPRRPAALIAVLLALAVILAVGGVIGAQIASLAQDLPRYQTTIREKVETVRSVTIGRVTRFVERLDELRKTGPGEPSRGRSVSQDSPRSPAPPPAPNAAGTGDTASAAAASPFTMLEKFVSPVLSPIAALGIAGDHAVHPFAAGRSPRPVHSAGRRPRSESHDDRPRTRPSSRCARFPCRPITTRSRSRV